MKSTILPCVIAVLAFCDVAYAQQPSVSPQWQQVGNFNCAANTACTVSCSGKSYEKVSSAVLLMSIGGSTSVLNIYDVSGRNLASILGQACSLDGMGFTPAK
jgi:hypothetical protein